MDGGPSRRHALRTAKRMAARTVAQTPPPRIANSSVLRGCMPAPASRPLAERYAAPRTPPPGRAAKTTSPASAPTTPTAASPPAVGRGPPGIPPSPSFASCCMKGISRVVDKKTPRGIPAGTRRSAPVRSRVPGSRTRDTSARSAPRARGSGRRPGRLPAPGPRTSPGSPLPPGRLGHCLTVCSSVFSGRLGW